VQDFVLRFYGRFVVVDHGASAAKISLLALNVTFDGAVHAEPHRLMMAAHRRKVADTTTVGADAIVVQPGVDADLLDTALWDVSGRRLTLAATGGFRWQVPPTDAANGVGLADLRQLSPGTPFDLTHMNAFGKAKPVAAIVDVAAGAGLVGQIDQAPSGFAPLRDASSAGGPFNLRLAEFVEVRLSLPDNNPQMVFEVTDEQAAEGRIALVTDANDPTMVTFSNLCTAGERTVDEEFACSYQVLVDPPPVPDRLVPVTPPTLGRQFPCYKAAFVQLEP
jgi:hypothetical protein